jgi:hypothetical protein
MKGHLDEDRKFFLDIVDDLASSEVIAERASQMTREDWAEFEREHADELDEMAETPTQPGTIDEHLQESVKQSRQRVSGIGDQDLLLMRRMRAQRICRFMLQVGRLHDGIYAKLLRYEIEQVQVLDAEIARRHLGRDQATAR